LSRDIALWDVPDTVEELVHRIEQLLRMRGMSIERCDVWPTHVTRLHQIYPENMRRLTAAPIDDYQALVW
jgi:hypothetical protein